ncbi:Coenzyme PQQ synthesis protein A [Pseudomonas frederiksbergensis]|uniref:Coenzyme PQQ synthesis protein A n=1 Tax=Pseudomonas frederiksbergensis TaxID=104087 RepID=A0A6L5BM25_9PSED|nr:Coenzyme PQQ synthesis protein A [Pseudomonas frederiksbergensis]
MYRSQLSHPPERSTLMSWSKPAYTDLRIGFEVTMYFASR